ncbi:hypothetical protein [Methylobacterium iners]|uniref:Uncharacterized protein n=1 Tax=Methylobacterium iners TaxID=418707 RepID=A0ABQ4S8G8_9HYPH|nr:hypothetical protein [Methylobacterium iners]GJD98088.1 hypothetical protein OCOJLMKI_5327 [Methylobacterium iners]
MVKLKLRRMRAAYDEIITQAGKRGHAPERVVGDLLAAQLADVESRATAYCMGNAKFPVLKTLADRVRPEPLACERRVGARFAPGLRLRLRRYQHRRPEASLRLGV